YSNMKRYFIVVAWACFMVTNQSMAQGKVKVPDAAKKSFSAKYPGATKVKWEKEDADYEVNFSENGIKMSVVFDGQGKLVETENEVSVSSLPAKTMDYVKEHYKNSKVKGAAKITKANGEVFYEAEINKTALIFDANGKYVKTAKD
ncbi:MAG: hypothetical protein JWQ38_708, partial [Flavipsychrobacter sp.]|nr:hypothetical protein [Flavipsychrobacter sp.]